MRTGARPTTGPDRQGPDAGVTSFVRPAGPIGIAILGSTGSVGRQTLDVIDHHPDRFRVVALAAGSNAEALAQQASRYQPDLLALDELDSTSPGPPRQRVMCGPEGLIAVATHPAADIVVIASSGHAAIEPTVRAIAAGKTIALANKETIVCAGELIMPLARQHRVEIRPVDSEHSALWQSLGRSSITEVARLILTASGGPFRETPLADLAHVTVAETLNHPTWSMGGKITVDSASLMNKGLEVIEARWLFDVPYQHIDVVIHPESIIHSLVEFHDGSQIAQLSLPDMRLPIQYALTYPEHAPGPCRRLSLADIGSLQFFAPDEQRFPSLSLARQAGEAGSTYPTVLSAADEMAVGSFLAGEIRFMEIPEVAARVVDRHRSDQSLSFEAIAAADQWARQEAAAVINAVVSDRHSSPQSDGPASGPTPT
jgi:1-deoxy-D-xylulose-5-phosphate reductoisomerase